MNRLSTIATMTLLSCGPMLGVGIQSAQAATLDFSALSQAGNGLLAVGGTNSQLGFTFSSGSAAFDVWQASSVNLPGLAAANTSLFEFFAGSTTSLADAGAAFTLQSIDLAPLIAGAVGTFTVTFTGKHPDASTVSQTFVVNDGAGLQTFGFSNFANVVSVAFAQGTNSGFFVNQVSGYQFDNVVVSPFVTGVPEPETFALLGLGLAGLGFRCRKKA